MQFDWGFFIADSVSCWWIHRRCVYSV